MLQRCIDHASDLQRVQLVNEITYNALTLVQDPYGNYVRNAKSFDCLFLTSAQVVQYILDLNDNRFSDAVIRQFTGNVCALSVQKFSSNVIEKVRLFLPCRLSKLTLYLVYSRCRAQHSQDAGRRIAESLSSRKAAEGLVWQLLCSGSFDQLGFDH